MADDKHAYQSIVGFFIGNLIGQAVGRHQAIEDEAEFLRKVEADSSAMLQGMLHVVGNEMTPKAENFVMLRFQVVLGQALLMRKTIRELIARGGVRPDTELKEALNLGLSAGKRMQDEHRKQQEG